MPHSSDVILFKVRINHEANEALALTIDCLRNSRDRTMRKIVPCLYIVSIVSLTVERNRYRTTILAVSIFYCLQTGTFYLSLDS